MVPCHVMRNLLNQWKLFLPLLLAALVVAIVVLLGMAELHEEIVEPSSMQMDQHMQALVHAEASGWLTGLMFALTWIGSPLAMFSAVPLVTAWMWWKRMREDAVLLLVAMVGGGALDAALKLHFRRVRPEVPWAFVHEHSFSFPSGHSVLAVTLYAMLVYLAMRRLRAAAVKTVVVLVALLLVLGIGFSRIYLGAHFPSDVLGGYFVGAVWVAGVIAADWWVRREGGSRRA